MAKFKLKLELVRKEDGTPEAQLATAKALSRQLRITAVTLLLTLGMIIAVTVAWFAMNREVNSSGMEIEIDSDTPNLVIKKSGDLDFTANNISVTYDQNPEDSHEVYSLAPAQHYPLSSMNTTWAVQWDADDHALYNKDSEPALTPDYTGLRYNSNGSSIDRSTGVLAAGAAALKYNPVPAYDENEDTRRYYLDYTINLASTDAALAISTLTAKLALADGFSVTTAVPQDPTSAAYTAYAAQEYKLAATVDFYIGSVSEANYKGKLNLAQCLDNDATNDTVTLQTGGTIPLTSATPITVVMRFYFDGALERTTGQAYVHSTPLTPAALGLKVIFTANEPAAS